MGVEIVVQPYDSAFDPTQRRPILVYDGKIAVGRPGGFHHELNQYFDQDLEPRLKVDGVNFGVFRNLFDLFGDQGFTGYDFEWYGDEPQQKEEIESEVLNELGYEQAFKFAARGDNVEIIDWRGMANTYGDHDDPALGADYPIIVVPINGWDGESGESEYKVFVGRENGFHAELQENPDFQRVAEQMNGGDDYIQTRYEEGRNFELGWPIPEQARSAIEDKLDALFGFDGFKFEASTGLKMMIQPGEGGSRRKGRRPLILYPPFPDAYFKGAVGIGRNGDYHYDLDEWLGQNGVGGLGGRTGEIDAETGQIEWFSPLPESVDQSELEREIAEALGLAPEFKFGSKLSGLQVLDLRGAEADPEYPSHKEYLDSEPFFFDDEDDHQAMSKLYPVVAWTDDAGWHIAIGREDGFHDELKNFLPPEAVSVYGTPDIFGRYSPPNDLVFYGEEEAATISGGEELMVPQEVKAEMLTALNDLLGTQRDFKFAQTEPQVNVFLVPNDAKYNLNGEHGTDDYPLIIQSIGKDDHGFLIPDRINVWVGPQDSYHQDMIFAAIDAGMKPEFGQEFDEAIADQKKEIGDGSVSHLTLARLLNGEVVSAGYYATSPQTPLSDDEDYMIAEAVMTALARDTDLDYKFGAAEVELVFSKRPELDEEVMYETKRTPVIYDPNTNRVIIGNRGDYHRYLQDEFQFKNGFGGLYFATRPDKGEEPPCVAGEFYAHYDGPGAPPGLKWWGENQPPAEVTNAALAALGDYDDQGNMQFEYDEDGNFKFGTEEENTELPSFADLLRDWARSFPEEEVAHEKNLSLEKASSWLRSTIARFRRRSEVVEEGAMACEECGFMHKPGPCPKSKGGPMIMPEDPSVVTAKLFFDEKKSSEEMTPVWVNEDSEVIGTGRANFGAIINEEDEYGGHSLWVLPSEGQVWIGSDSYTHHAQIVRALEEAGLDNVPRIAAWTRYDRLMADDNFASPAEVNQLVQLGPSVTSAIGLPPLPVQIQSASGEIFTPADEDGVDDEDFKFGALGDDFRVIVQDDPMPGWNKNFEFSDIRRPILFYAEEGMLAVGRPGGFHNELEEFMAPLPRPEDANYAGFVDDGGDRVIWFGTPGTKLIWEEGAMSEEGEPFDVRQFDKQAVNNAILEALDQQPEFKFGYNEQLESQPMQPRAIYIKFNPVNSHPGPSGVAESPWLYSPEENAVLFGPPNSYHYEMLQSDKQLRESLLGGAADEAVAFWGRALQEGNILSGRVTWPPNSHASGPPNPNQEIFFYGNPTPEQREAVAHALGSDIDTEGDFHFSSREPIAPDAA